MTKTFEITVNRFITRDFIKGLVFKPFNESDWMEFMGCDSPVPFRAETTVKILGKEFDLSVILDGNSLSVYGYEYEYGALDYVEDISTL